MDKVIKKIILYCSGTEGFLTSNENKFLGYKLHRERIELISALRMMLQKVVQTVKDDEINKLIAEIESGRVVVETLTDVETIINQKRLGKQSVKINYEVLNTFAEMACWKVCDDCDYKKKNCRLRKNFKKVADIGIYPPCELDRIELERSGAI